MSLKLASLYGVLHLGSMLSPVATKVAGHINGSIVQPNHVWPKIVLALSKPRQLRHNGDRRSPIDCWNRNIGNVRGNGLMQMRSLLAIATTMLLPSLHKIVPRMIFFVPSRRNLLVPLVRSCFGCCLQRDHRLLWSNDWFLLQINLTLFLCFCGSAACSSM